LIKPADQIIRLNIPKVLKLEIFHPRAYPITISYQISNGGEGIIKVQSDASLYLLATSPSQLGNHSLKITLTDNYLKSSSETIKL